MDDASTADLVGCGLRHAACFVGVAGHLALRPRSHLRTNQVVVVGVQGFSLHQAFLQQNGAAVSDVLAAIFLRQVVVAFRV